MYRAFLSRSVSRTFASAEPFPSTFGVPLFLCPALARLPTSSLITPQPTSRPATWRTTQQFICQRRSNHTEVPSSSDKTVSAVLESAGATPEGQSSRDGEDLAPAARELPLSCSGCGAFAQTTDRNQLGFFDLESKYVRRWLHPKRNSGPVKEVVASENQVVESALAGLDEAMRKELGLETEQLIVQETPAKIQDPEPVCSRCHLLLHEIGNPEKVEMFHPTVDSLRETIEESPHKNNHIYHIIDAADFPMSLIPRLNVLLGDIPLRTRNRRSRSAKYMKDRKMEISFVITRGDLLGPTKEQVDKMMPKLREVLREALGRVGHRVRLGNVHCVSALRSWWTKELKQDIWKRGGAGWFVGKVNVGKSKLFQEVFPKGKVTHESKSDGTLTDPLDTATPGEDIVGIIDRDTEDFGDLLPPARPLEMYPSMPIVSSHPGTTASPIRIPFGNHKGELIDLPGLARSDLENFVKHEHRDSLIMRSRIVPEQITIQRGRSLVLGGGLIRITPTTPGLDFLAYNFTRLSEHLTSTEKAVEFQAQTRVLPGVENIATEEAAEKIQSAGTFKLRYDVTRARAGPLTRKHRGGVPVEKLPFRVLSLDILIEGVGYVEFVAQVRTKHLEDLLAAQADEEFLIRSAAIEAKSSLPAPDSEPRMSDDPFQALADNRIDESPAARKAAREKEKQKQYEEARRARLNNVTEWPAVEVFTPEGKFVDYRQPIAGWLTNKPRVLDKHKRKRPRRSMKGQKKMAKVMARSHAADE